MSASICRGCCFCSPEAAPTELCVPRPHSHRAAGTRHQEPQSRTRGTGPGGQTARTIGRGQAGLTGDSHAAATAPRHGCTRPSAVKDVTVQTGRSQGRRPQGVLGSRPYKHVCARTPVCPTAWSPREAPQVSTRGSPAEGRAFSRQFHGASDGPAHTPPARTSPVARSPPTAPQTTAPHRGDHCPPPKG